MTGWLLGLVGAWCVLRLSGADRRWPWRVRHLDPSARRPTPGSSDRPGSTPPRAPARAAGRFRRRAAAARRARVAADLVTVIDLLHVTVSAGHSLHVAIQLVGEVPSGPVASALASSSDAFARGRTMAEAIAELPRRLGPEAAALTSTLLAALHSGAAPAPALQRLADSHRRRQRRRAESRVRRLPVVLLGPLVGLVLPAFVVLTIVPVAITTARAGLLPASA